MPYMTNSERHEFKLFCEQASDRQLEGIIEKEREAAKHGDPFRKACYQIAMTEAAARGIT